MAEFGEEVWMEFMTSCLRLLLLHVFAVSGLVHISISFSPLLVWFPVGETDRQTEANGERERESEGLRDRDR